MEEGPWLSEEVRSELGSKVVAGAEAVGYKGLATFEFLRDDNGEFFFLEVNPRASRTIPFIAKAIGLPIEKIAAKVMSGKKLNEFNSALFKVLLSLSKRVAADGEGASKFVTINVQNSKTIEDAKIIEENSNQILDFTREVKNLPEQDKIKIVEALWSIIYSNNDADIYETNLMRRLAGLLYIDNKTMGDIKEKIKQNLK